jgi:tetratricopeptide (TPR) repeat protein
MVVNLNLKLTNSNIKMKKIYLFIFIISIANSVFAQKFNVVNASIALRQDNLVEAKQYIDEAFLNEATSNDPKMWNYRAPIYLQIALKQPELDDKAVIKSTIAHIKCLQIGKKDKIIVKKWTSKEDILAGLMQCGYKLFNLAIDKYNAEEYTIAIDLYNTIFDIIPFDEEDQLKRGNITKETILYNSFFASSKLKDNKLSKELLQKLIDINFNEPAIYIYMSDLYKDEDNIDKSIEYLSLGREMFEDNQSIINTEINLYIELGRTIELIAKLVDDINLDQENPLLFFNRGTIYDQEGQLDNAIKDYNKAIELDPSSFGSNYNLGALYFNKAVELNNLANSTSNDVKYKKIKKEADLYFDKGLPFLEAAYQLNSKDKNTLLSLKQLYYMKGDYKKSEDIKRQISSL